MSDEKLYFRGTTFLLSYVWESRPKRKEYMLVECHMKGYVFQLVCISGYDAGTIHCYITDDPDVVNAAAVTYDHLCSQLKSKVEEGMTLEAIYERPEAERPDPS